MIPRAWLHKLYDLYGYLFAGGAPDPEFNFSKLVMPPKGRQSDDAPGSVTRTPEKVRPLNLSNIDNKLISSLACLPICEVAEKTVSSFQ